MRDDKLVALFSEHVQPVCADKFISDCHDKLVRSQRRSVIVKLLIIIVMILFMLIITPLVVAAMGWVNAQLGTLPTVAKTSVSIINAMNLSSMINQVFVCAGIIISACMMTWVWLPGFYSRH